jgi:hypothetical protein
VHLIGFYYKNIYYDARSSECQMTHLCSTGVGGGHTSGSRVGGGGHTSGSLGGPPYHAVGSRVGSSNDRLRNAGPGCKMHIAMTITTTPKFQVRN